MTIKDSIERGARSIEDRDAFAPEARAKHMNASEAGTCIRKQWFTKKAQRAGAQPAQDARGYMRRGHAVEKWVIDVLTAANAPLLYAGKNQCTWVDQINRISGTPDGVLAYDDEWVPIEIKSFDPRTNKSNLPRMEHELQLQINMALIEKFVDLPESTKLTRGKLIYVNASDFDDIIEFDIDFAQYGILESLKPRADKILNTRKVENLDREGKREDRGRQCRYCPFVEQCGVDLDGAKTGARGNRGSKLAVVAKEYIDLKDQEAAVKEAIAESREGILAELTSRKTKHIEVAGIEIDLADVDGRKTLDKKAMEKDGIDVGAYEKIGKSSQRLTVKRLQG